MTNDESKGHLITVTGPIKAAQAGVTDAHNHVWISRLPGISKNAPVLDDQTAIIEELRDFRNAGGGTIIDCQPGGCGRDGRKLRALSDSSHVKIIASTGYHLRKYYPENYWLFRASTGSAAQHFISELTEGLQETSGNQEPIQAGLIKIACQDSLEKSPMHLMEAAAISSIETGCGIQVHTEKGSDAERIMRNLLDFGLPADKLIFCHMDKRADFELHRNLAGGGILLEYDTFFLPKYSPEVNVWPLLERMVAAGFASHIAIGTDMAEKSMWARLGGSPGMAALIWSIISRMESMGFEEATIRKLTGKNIVSRLLRSMSPTTKN